MKKKSIEKLIFSLGDEICKKTYFIPKVEIQDYQTDIIITTNNDIDYYVFIFLPYEALTKVISEIQIYLFKRIKQIFYEKTKQHISPNVDKNSHLIICSSIPDDVLTSNVLMTVSTIEEDAFYYKKQVIYYNAKVLAKFFKHYVESLNTTPDITFSVHCNKIISDPNRYIKFTKNKDEIYAFIAILFEKIPFLTLSVIKSNEIDLDEILIRLLTPDEAALLPSLLGMANSKDQIHKWIHSEE